MEDLHERLIKQIDGLVAFLALGHEEVFDVVREHYAEWVEEPQRETMPDSFGLFRAQVSNSAFLLGYSFFEAFLADVIRQIYNLRPIMLPKDKELKYHDILNANDYASVLAAMIDREVRAALYGSIEKVRSYFETKLNLDWPEFDRVVEVSRLRNCLIHNMGRADARLAEVSAWEDGQQIELTPDEVNELGLDVREFAEHLYAEAQKQLGVETGK
jgi:hypothetical protein